MRTSFELRVLAAALVFGMPPMAASFVGVPPVAAQDARVSDTIDRSVPITGAEVPCVNGKAKGYDCHNVDLVSFLPYTALGADEVLDVLGIHLRFQGLWGWTDSATGREFAIVGLVGGTSFVEVTDPVNPKYLGTLPRPQGTGLTSQRDVKVYSNHAFITAFATGPSGVQVFDLTQLLHVTAAPVTFRETARYDGVGSIHTLALNPETGYAYASHSDACGGLLMLDVRTPARMTFAGCWVDSVVGPVHETACFVYRGPDRPYQGRELCFSAHESRGISIADVTDKQHPRMVGAATYPNITYAHQGWLSEDQHYLFVDDELDELSGGVPKTRLLVFDVSRLEQPVLALEHFGETAATDHTIYVRGRYLYQGMYKGGFRVLDMADPRHPQTAGYFDTFPDADGDAGLGGAHDNFPYFKKEGLVAVNDCSDGLFLLRFRR